MEIRQEGSDHAELKTGVDEYVSFSCASRNPALVLQGCVLQCSHRGRSHGHHTAILLKSTIDLRCWFFRNREKLAVHFVLFNFFNMYRLKSSQAHVQSDLYNLHTAAADLFQNRWSEVQSGGGSGNAPALSRINSLVTIPVCRAVLSSDVGRQRDMSQAFQNGKKIGRRLKSQCPLSIVPPAGNLSLKLRTSL